MPELAVARDPTALAMGREMRLRKPAVHPDVIQPFYSRNPIRGTSPNMVRLAISYHLEVVDHGD